MTLFRTLTRFALLAFAACMVLAFLLIGITAAVLTLVWSLLTGRKPAVYTTFTRFRDASRQFQERARWSQGSSPSARSDDIVDVQAHEVRSALDDKR